MSLKPDLTLQEFEAAVRKLAVALTMAVREAPPGTYVFYPINSNKDSSINAGNTATVKFYNDACDVAQGLLPGLSPRQRIDVKGAAIGRVARAEGLVDYSRVQLPPREPGLD